MKLNQRQRWLILGALLLVTIGAGMMADDEPVPDKGKRSKSVNAAKVSSSGGEKRSAPASEKAPEAARVALAFPEPPAVAEADAEAAPLINPFRQKSWYVAPPPPPPPPPPKPKAPPLPFQFLGKISEDGETRVFLSQQGKYVVAKVGDVINGTYTVEEIGGGRMTFLYQPLQEKQVLAIGADK